MPANIYNVHTVDGCSDLFKVMYYWPNETRYGIFPALAAEQFLMQAWLQTTRSFNLKSLATAKESECHSADSCQIVHWCGPFPRHSHKSVNMIHHQPMDKPLLTIFFPQPTYVVSNNFKMYGNFYTGMPYIKNRTCIHTKGWVSVTSRLPVPVCGCTCGFLLL